MIVGKGGRLHLKMSPDKGGTREVGKGVNGLELLSFLSALPPTGAVSKSISQGPW